MGRICLAPRERYAERFVEVCLKDYKTIRSTCHLFKQIADDIFWSKNTFVVPHVRHGGTLLETFGFPARAIGQIRHLYLPLDYRSVPHETLVAKAQKIQRCWRSGGPDLGYHPSSRAHSYAREPNYYHHLQQEQYRQQNLEFVETMKYVTMFPLALMRLDSLILDISQLSCGNGGHHTLRPLAAMLYAFRYGLPRNIGIANQIWLESTTDEERQRMLLNMFRVAKFAVHNLVVVNGWRNSLEEREKEVLQHLKEIYSSEDDCSRNIDEIHQELEKCVPSQFKEDDPMKGKGLVYVRTSLGTDEVLGLEDRGTSCCTWFRVEPSSCKEGVTDTIRFDSLTEDAWEWSTNLEVGLYDYVVLAHGRDSEQRPEGQEPSPDY